jgi:two-component system, response regulator YesN
MYKVLIVDDEEIIRNGLCHFIDWEKYGFSICGEADCGETALRKIKDYQPHLVLLDITMPGMSGLDILEKYHNACTDSYKPLFLILTGYSDFEYAQKALNYGAQGYLLKPVDEDMLEDKLRELADFLSSKNKEGGISASDTEYMKQFERMLSTGVIAPAFEKQFDDNSLYQLILFSSVCCGFSDRMPQLQKAVTDFFPFADITFFGQNSFLTAVVKNTPENTVLRYIGRFCEKYGKKAGGPVASIGPSLQGLRGALSSYQTARKLFDILFFSDTTLFLQEQDLLPEQEGITKPNPLLPHVSNLLIFIETYDITGEDRFMAQQKTIFQTGRYAPQTVKKMFMAFVIEIYNNIHEKYPEKQLNMPQVLDLVNAIYGQQYLSGVLEAVRNFIAVLTDSFNKNSSEATIAKIIQYIRHNYRSDLKLEDLGTMFNCNSAYLGKKFKKITGISFNTYMDITRIEAAKRMLTSTNLKIYNISDIVGYTNPDYFYLKFRKYVKVTPKQFRENHTSRETSDNLLELIPQGAVN